MSDSKRSLRRHHRDRLKTRARRILKGRQFNSTEDLEYRVNRQWNNPKVCSCWMCGNPRRKKSGWNYDPLTIPEKREYDRFNDSYLDFLSSNHIYSDDEN